MVVWCLDGSGDAPHPPRLQVLVFASLMANNSTVQSVSSLSNNQGRDSAAIQVI
jgi:hypothetical protein